MMTRSLLVASIVVSILCMAQDVPFRKAPSVTMSPVTTPTITRGKPGIVDLQFRIGAGFHINSNTPKEEYLIPTILKLEPPTDIVVGKIKYPAGEDASFPFAPDEKLNVYSGQFALQVTVRPLKTVLPGKYMVRGNLKYQACDNAACYPPKQLPVEFEVKIAKGASQTPTKNPPQSPHAHR